MYTLQLFSIGYTRDSHRHFVSKTAEETFFNRYALNSEAIICERVFNPKAREFSINITDIPEYEQASYLIATYNDKYYYYYITDFSVINGITVVYKVEEDIYHTYFNNRGGYFDFCGRLSQSNSNADDILYPTGTPFFIDTEERFFDTEKIIPIVYLNFQKSGILTIRMEKAYNLIDYAIAEVLSALKDGNLDLYLGTTKQFNETFNLLGVFIVPEKLVKEPVTGVGQFNWKTSNGVYTLYPATGLKVSKQITPNKKTANFFGTPFKKINIGNEQTEIEIAAQLFLSNGDPSLLLSVNDTTFLSVIDDFAITGTYSEFSNYLTQNKISLAMNVVSAVAGLGTAIATKNPIPAINAVKTTIDTGNAVYQESIKEQSIVTNGGGNAIATYEKSKLNLAGITIQSYTAKRQNNIDNYFETFGGECSGKYLRITDIINTDGDKSVYRESGFFYKFSYIETGYGGTIGSNAPFINKIADMFTNGIRIYYIQE